MESCRSSRSKDILERLRKIREPSTKITRRYYTEMSSVEYRNWKKVDTRSIHVEGTLISQNMNPYIEWCTTYCESRWMTVGKIIHFEDDNEAAHFLMVWK